MRVAVTGTPGTGKTTVTNLLKIDLTVHHLTDIVREHDFVEGMDEDRDSIVVDLDALKSWLDGRENVLFESHLAHQFPADRVVVLRCHPRELEKRLLDRGKSEPSATENAESEALDVILTEAVDRHGLANVYEINTTDREPDAVATDIEAVVTGEREPSAGTVSFVEYL